MRNKLESIDVRTVDVAARYFCRAVGAEGDATSMRNVGRLLITYCANPRARKQIQRIVDKEWNYEPGQTEATYDDYQRVGSKGSGSRREADED